MVEEDGDMRVCLVKLEGLINESDGGRGREMWIWTGMGMLTV